MQSYKLCRYLAIILSEVTDRSIPGNELQMYMNETAYFQNFTRSGATGFSMFCTIFTKFKRPEFFAQQALSAIELELAVLRLIGRKLPALP